MLNFFCCFLTHFGLFFHSNNHSCLICYGMLKCKWIFVLCLIDAMKTHFVNQMFLLLLLFVHLEYQQQIGAHRWFYTRKSRPAPKIEENYWCLDTDAEIKLNINNRKPCINQIQHLYRVAVVAIESVPFDDIFSSSISISIYQYLAFKVILSVHFFSLLLCSSL